MKGKVRKPNKPDNNSLGVFKAYHKGFNSRRAFMELIIPFAISLATVFVFFYSNSESGLISRKIADTNSYLASIIALQIGFNITSLALISSFNKEAIKQTFQNVTDEGKEAVLKQLLATFIYCILIQTFLIIFGTVYNTVIESLKAIAYNINIPSELKKWGALTVTFIWMFTVLHSFMVFYRNVVLIYKFVLVKFKN